MKTSNKINFIKIVVVSIIINRDSIYTGRNEHYLYKIDFFFDVIVHFELSWYADGAWSLGLKCQWLRRFVKFHSLWKLGERKLLWHLALTNIYHLRVLNWSVWNTNCMKERQSDNLQILNTANLPQRFSIVCKWQRKFWIAATTLKPNMFKIHLMTCDAICSNIFDGGCSHSVQWLLTVCRWKRRFYNLTWPWRENANIEVLIPICRAYSVPTPLTCFGVKNIEDLTWVLMFIEIIKRVEEKW